MNKGRVLVVAGEDRRSAPANATRGWRAIKEKMGSGLAITHVASSRERTNRALHLLLQIVTFRAVFPLLKPIESAINGRTGSAE